MCIQQTQNREQNHFVGSHAETTEICRDCSDLSETTLHSAHDSAQQSTQALDSRLLHCGPKTCATPGTQAGGDAKSAPITEDSFFDRAHRLAPLL